MGLLIFLLALVNVGLIYYTVTIAKQTENWKNEALQRYDDSMKDISCISLRVRDMRVTMKQLRNENVLMSTRIDELNQKCMFKD